MALLIFDFFEYTKSHLQLQERTKNGGGGFFFPWKGKEEERRKRKKEDKQQKNNNFFSMSCDSFCGHIKSFGAAVRDVTKKQQQKYIKEKQFLMGEQIY